MIQVVCDGCLEPLDRSDGYLGLDEYVAPDDEDDGDDPADDDDYAFLFHNAGCVFAWSCARVAEVVDG